MAKTETKEHYTLAEIAKRWGCSHSTVLTLVYRGVLRAIDISSNPRGKSRFIVPAPNLEAFEQERTTPPPEQPAQRKRRVKVPAGQTIEFFT